MNTETVLTENMEDYLEMFYRIIEKQGYIRPVDLSAAVKVRPSSVTRMIQKLDEAGFISYKKYRNISLTDKGFRYGRFLVWRDEVLKEFLTLLKVEVGIAEQVEGIEHYITPPTMAIIQKLLLYFLAKPDRLADLEAHQNRQLYPGNEELSNLRAWLFRHSNN
ncbi:MAG: transcriptional regulator MntR [Bacillota bacterium]